MEEELSRETNAKYWFLWCDFNKGKFYLTSVAFLKMTEKNDTAKEVAINPEWLREYFLMDQELALLKELLKKSSSTTIEAILSYLESEQALLPTLSTLIRVEIALCSGF